MLAHCKITAASDPLAACLSRELREVTNKACSSIEDLAVARRLTLLSTWVRLPRLKAQFKILLLVTVTSSVAACSSWQNQVNSLEQIATLEQMRYEQLLTNLSNELRRRDSIPSLGVTSSGVATASLSGSAGWSITQPFDFSHNTKTLSPSATAEWQNNWTITPISDPVDLTNLRALYGLLYRNDNDIAKIIAETLLFYSTSSPHSSPPPDIYASRCPKGSICYDWIKDQQTACGITWSTHSNNARQDFWDAMPSKENNFTTGFTITEPGSAMAAYLTALNAFPDLPTSTSNPTPTSFPVQISISHLPPPPVPADVFVSAAKSSQQPTGTSSKPSALNGCYGAGPQANGVTGNLAQQYGLLYPGKDAVFTSLRNGLSADCRSYQLSHVQMKDEMGKILNPAGDLLFARSLFWQDPHDGSWQPGPLPQDVFKDGQPIHGLPREKWDHLDRFANYDFWTTASACVSDFIILAINATANSHAAAQNAPKGGTTPASLGGS